MATRQRTLSLRDAGVSLIDCVHKTPPAIDAGYPYIAIPQIKDGRIEFREARRISADDFVNWTRKAMPQPYDVVLSRRCNPGETAWVPPDFTFALGQNLVLLRASGDVVYPPFLRWLVRSPEWWSEIQQNLNVGAVFDSLKCADIPNFKLPIPSLADQRAIAHILGALDDKIELNRKMSATLEAIARALFKSWFVDFDPVRAKAEGRDPGLLAEIAALFPDSFEDSELGEIPKGWSVEPIGALAEIVGGSTPSTSVPAYWDGPFGWVTPKDLAALETPVLLSTNRTISEQGLSTISSGLLPIGALLLSSRAPIGYLAVAELPVAINQGFIAMKAREGISNLFLLRWSESAHDDILARANGSTFLEISKSSFRPIPVVVPAAPIMRAFDDIARPLHDRLVLSEMQSRSLVAIRDALLPKLISGEVRVSST